MQKAADFVNNEKEFHLGFLPTEQSNPKTEALDSTFRSSVADGVRLLQSVDRDIAPMAERVLGSREFEAMKNAISNAVVSGNKVVFSGCGATGRLSILLESMWRRFFIKLCNEQPGVYKKIAGYENSVFSIMTGGDFALIRSVESFEDYQEFGRRQVRDLAIKKGDVLVAITEGGETSSVLGTVSESVERGASVFLLFNNPTEILRRLKRSREAIDDPNVTVLDLFCGPMALSGSTRMQATTSEQLIAGAALESALNQLLKQYCGVAESETDYAHEFEKLLAGLENDEAVSSMAEYIGFEEKIYRSGGLVTYYAGPCMLDVFTDTTERSPTFMLPPFRKCDDKKSPVSWAFVKHPMFSTSDAWRFVLGRETRCLTWTVDDYRAMGASKKISDNPPAISRDDIGGFLIGNEADESRFSTGRDAAVMVVSLSDMENKKFAGFKNAFDREAKRYDEKAVLAIGCRPDNAGSAGSFGVSLENPPGILSLMEHMAVKLVLNTISTGTMVRMGKVKGNWMSFVEVTNKKLMDRGTRIIASLCGVSYEKACHELFDSIEHLKKNARSQGEKISAVQYTIERMNEKQMRRP